MIVFKNFLSVVRRYKVAFLMNLLGLGVSLAIAALVFMQVRYDLTFDPEQPARDRICLFTLDYGDEGVIAVSPKPMERLVSEVPGVRASCLMEPFPVSVFPETVNDDGLPVRLNEKFRMVSENFADVFDFDFSETSDGLLATENSVIIPESMARKISGPDGAVGKVLKSPDGGKEYTVTGVYRDFSPNSTLDNHVFAVMNRKRDYDKWGNFNYNMMVRLEDGADRKSVEEAIIRKLEENEVNTDGGGTELMPELVSLDDLHFSGKALFDTFPKASRAQLLLFITVALLLVAVACVNMVNFNMALAPLRLKSVNTMKVLGSPRGSLSSGIAFESVAVAAIAWGLSIIIVSLVKESPAAVLIDPEISLTGQYQAFIVTFAVAAVAGMLSGIYPGLYITSFPSALALKGNFALSPKGRMIRTLLVGFQFVVAFALIACIGAIYLQSRYMQNMDTGYRKSNLLSVSLDGMVDSGRWDAMDAMLLNMAEVERISYASAVLSGAENISKWGRDIKGENESFQVVHVSPEFIGTIGAEITEGRDFREGNGACWIFNESARKVFGLELGEKVGNENIVGFVDDVRVGSMKMSIEPMGFMLDRKGSFHSVEGDVMYVRVRDGSDISMAKKRIAEVLDSFVPDYPFEVKSAEDVFASTYSRERNISLLVAVFSLVAVLISLVGVFGIVMFDSESRRKEIAVRKVMGAATSDIVMMFNRYYMMLLLVCMLLSTPVSLYFMSRWLGQFAERVQHPWWTLFPAAVLLSLVIVSAVSGQCLRAAMRNPVENLKNE